MGISPRWIETNMMYCDCIVSKFKLQLSCYMHSI